MLWFSDDSPSNSYYIRKYAKGLAEVLGMEFVTRAERAKRVSCPAMLACLFTVLLAAGCTPTVKVATDEPITINLNVNIQHEIRVKVDKELDDIFAEDSELF